MVVPMTLLGGVLGKASLIRCSSNGRGIDCREDIAPAPAGDSVFPVLLQCRLCIAACRLDMRAAAGKDTAPRQPRRPRRLPFQRLPLQPPPPLNPPHHA